MHKKLIDIIDKNDKIIGNDTWENAHNHGFLHREIQVWFYNKKGEVLLQKRSKNKKMFPGLLDASVGGHVESGEDYLSAAQREVLEETGLKIKKNQLKFITTIKSHDKDLVSRKQNNIFRKIYVAEYNESIKKLKKNKKEIDHFCFLNIDDLLNMPKNDRNKYVSIFWDREYKMALNKIAKLSNQKSIDILAICGSGRGVNSNTGWMLKEIKNNLADNNIYTEIIFLNDYNINDCEGCEICRFSNKQCKIKDDMQLIGEKMKTAKFLIFGSPNYFKNVSGLMKRFMDRTNSFIRYDEKIKKTNKTLSSKPVFGVCVGGEELEDTQFCEDAMLRFFKAHNFDIVGMLKAKADKPLEIKNNKIVKHQLAEESQKIIKVIK